MYEFFACTTKPSNKTHTIIATMAHVCVSRCRVIHLWTCSRSYIQQFPYISICILPISFFLMNRTALRMCVAQMNERRRQTENNNIFFHTYNRHIYSSLRSPLGKSAFITYRPLNAYKKTKEIIKHYYNITI